MNLARFSLLFVSTLAIAYTQNISHSVNDFSIKLLAATNSETDNLNIALSPFTIWSLLTIISEGASGNTLRQLKTVLKHENDIKKLRDEYRYLHSSLLKETEDVKLEFTSAIYTNDNYKLLPQFQRTAHQFYNVAVTPIDFRRTKEATNSINEYIAKNTHNRITSLVTQDDLRDAYIFLTSVLYFKGNWKTPFNKSATKPDAFNDEKGNKIGDVQMMYHAGYFPYKRIENIKAHALELPYGDDEKVSMVVILPFKGNTISNALNLMSQYPFNSILQSLDLAFARFGEEEMQVYLPKFKVQSEFVMDRVLNRMGIKDLFNSQQAELLGIVDQYLYVTKVLQRAEIEVDEEGSIASAAAGAATSYKAPPARFYANKPFLYFLVEKPTRSIIFAGAVKNPNNI